MNQLNLFESPQETLAAFDPWSVCKGAELVALGHGGAKYRVLEATPGKLTVRRENAGAIIEEKTIKRDRLAKFFKKGG